MTFKTPPPTPQHAKVTFPTPHVLQVTLSRPKDLNCINTAGHNELHALWEWMDEEPSIRVGVLTGEGRAFCAGADLKGMSYLDPSVTYRRLAPDIPFIHNVLLLYLMGSEEIYVLMEWNRMEQPSEQRRGIQTTTAVVGIRGSFPTERKEAYYLRGEWDLSGWWM